MSDSSKPNQNNNDPNKARPKGNKPAGRRHPPRKTGPTRRQAREAVMQLLYSFDLNPDASFDIARQYLHEQLNYPKLEELAYTWLTGTRTQLEVIDAELDQVSEGWPVSRMPAVDRNILRLATFELRFQPETPMKVAINEALDIAKQYSSADSVAFINGVLDKIAHKKRESTLPDSETGDDAEPTQSAPEDQ